MAAMVCMVWLLSRVKRKWLEKCCLSSVAPVIAAR